MNDATKQAAEAAAALAPAATREITGNGKKYLVRRLVTRQIWPILRAGLPIIEGLVGLVGPLPPAAEPGPPLAAVSAASGPAAGQPSDVPAKPLDALLGGQIASFLRLMAEHGDRITEVVAIALDETTRKVGEFEPQEIYLALQAIIRTNTDFFTDRVAPLLGLDPSLVSALAAQDGAVGSALRTLGAGETPASS